MRDQRPGDPEIDAEAVGQTDPPHRERRDGFMRYVGSQVGMWTFVVILFVAGLIAIIIYANVY